LAVTEDDGCLPQDATVIDVGSGAGLPGLVWAIARPDLQITLVEPLERRVRFLEQAVAQLALPNVTVERARAQQVRITADRVTARAVARTAALVQWLAPLVAPGGEMVLLKGRQAADEVAEATGWLDRNGWRAQVRDVGQPARTRVVVVDRVMKG
jgi:16S rRNA (guanine527-N7)-methyltransferase